ncbi:MAG: competence/damage-inducible protein A [Ruminococcaceae bacterium]|nr:competence/damage-inducible protein A [Oscillospiraceae bacterium]
MNGEIIAVGTELLLGNIVNTNAQFLSEELSNIGINVYYQTVVGDNKERLEEVIKCALSRADLLILTGGLGPTDDDLTKETVASLLGLDMYLHKESQELIEKYLNKKISQSNLKQAYIPKGAIILKNDNGTAPGIIIENGEKIIVLLPGPPKEMAPMFSQKVKPYLEKKSPYVMRSKILRLFGIGESSIGDKIKDLMQNDNPTVAPYAKDNETILRVTARAASKEEADNLNSKMIKEIDKRLGEFIYSHDDTALNIVCARKLIEKNITIAAAESCTAGLFAATLAETPGISSVLFESVVTYANEAKEKYLGVKHETLEKFGAVSEETAREMADGIRERSKADIGISITGLAGPDGGTEKKPVGLVYIGIATEDGTKTYELKLIGRDRNKIRHAAVMNALSIVYKSLE